jgi:hypothetical protein
MPSVVPKSDLIVKAKGLKGLEMVWLGADQTVLLKVFRAREQHFNGILVGLSE